MVNKISVPTSPFKPTPQLVVSLLIYSAISPRPIMPVMLRCVLKCHEGEGEPTSFSQYNFLYSMFSNGDMMITLKCCSMQILVNPSSMVFSVRGWCIAVVVMAVAVEVASFSWLKFLTSRWEVIHLPTTHIPVFFSFNFRTNGFCAAEHFWVGVKSLPWMVIILVI